MDWDKPYFENYETPYVPHPWSKPLPETMKLKISEIIAEKRFFFWRLVNSVYASAILSLYNALELKKSSFFNLADK